MQQGGELKECYANSEKRFFPVFFFFTEIWYRVVIRRTKQLSHSLTYKPSTGYYTT